MTMILMGREDKVAPAQFQNILKREGGLNPYGEPILRLVWSQSRKTWIEGEWTDMDSTGTLIRKVYEARYRPKYWYLDPCWVIEKWIPASKIYSTPRLSHNEWKWRKKWARKSRQVAITELVTEGHGPYPSRGDWEYASHLVVAPDPTLLRYIAKDLMRPTLSDGEAAAAMQDEEAREERRVESTQEDIIDDNWDAFRGIPHSVLDSTKQAYWPKEAK